MTDGEFGYTLSLAQDYVRHVLQIPQPGPAASRVSRVLRDVASSVQREVEQNLKPCLDSFDVGSIDTARTIFNQVMEKEFEDGIINWGRIVTVFAFEGILSKKLLRERISPDVDASRVSYFVAEFITTNMREWIRQNGGWVGRRHVTPAPAEAPHRAYGSLRVQGRHSRRPGLETDASPEHTARESRRPVHTGKMPEATGHTTELALDAP